MGREMDVETTDLREYLGVLRTRKWTIILATALVLGSALFFSTRQTPLYEAEARLLLSAPADPSGYFQLTNLQTEAEIVSSEPVAARVIEELDLNTSSHDLVADLNVEPVQEFSLVLQITYVATSPELAANVPNSFAENYIEYKREQSAEVMEAGRQSIQERISSVQTRLTEVAQEIDSPEVQDNGALLTTLETERNTLIARLGVLQQQLDDFQSNQPTELSGGQLIDPAAQPITPSSPNHIRNGLLALIMGLAMGVGFAFLRERLDDRFRGRPDLSRALKAPVLASVPKIAQARRRKQPRLAIQVNPTGHAAEAYKSLRTSVLFLSDDGGFRSLLITSASAGEGKTMTAGNLALALAQGGTRVIVVSADLRRPALELYFEVDNSSGLSDWLLAPNGQDPFAIVQDPGIPNLRIVPSGSIPPNPAELLSSRRFSALIQSLEDSADLVLIDSPPVFPVTDPLVLISRIGAAILVVDAEKTHRTAAIHAKEELERVGGKVIGSVYNSVDLSSSSYGRYGSYKYGGYSPAPAPAPPGIVGEADDESRSRRSLFKSRR